MPHHVIPAILFVANLLAAPMVLARPDARAAATCDHAARRAALSEGVPLNVLRAITRVETGRTTGGEVQPWPWTINVEGRGIWFSSEIEAKSYVFDIFKAGARSFDIGCFQINYRWHGKAFRSIDAMFDPDENAIYAARFLKNLHDELGSWPAAAGAYHSRTHALAQAYTARYQSALAALDGTAPTQVAGVARDPFTDAAAPLIPRQTQAGQAALGSLVTTSSVPTAFIAFN